MDADREAHLEAVLAETVEPLRRFLARRTDTATAEDVLSETLLVCWRRREDLPVAPGEALPWAYAVARFCLANAERSARRRARLQAKVAASGAAPRRGPSLTTPEQARLADALAALGEDDAEVLRLWAWEQLTPAEIGTVLGVSGNAAGVRLHRARARLREKFEQGGKTPAGPGHERAREGRKP